MSTPRPFIINLPERESPNEVESINPQDSYSFLFQRINENFERVQFSLNDIREWQNLAYDYQNGPLGVLNLHSDVDHSVPPKDYDVLTWINNQWTNFNLLNLNGVGIEAKTLNQLNNVETVTPKENQVLIYDPDLALQQQNTLRNTGTPNNNGDVLYDDGNPIPDTLSTNPNDPNFVQPWISRYLRLSDLIDVTANINLTENTSFDKNSKHLLFFDPTSTEKQNIGKTTTGIWDTIKVPNSRITQVLSSDNINGLYWSELTTSLTGAKKLFELEDMLPNPLDIGTESCGTDTLEFGQEYNLKVVDNLGNGTPFYKFTLDNSAQKWKLNQNERLVLCTNDRYHAIGGIELSAFSEINLDSLAEIVIQN